MPQYAFTVTDDAGTRQTGTLVASDVDAVVTTLSNQGLIVVRVAPVGAQSLLPFTHNLGSITTDQLVALTEQIAALLGAGIPVHKGLEVILAETQDARVRFLLVELCSGLATGNQLSDLLRQFPSVFSEHYVAMVVAGEQSGELADVMMRLSRLIENSEMMRKRVKSALVYPTFVIGLAVVVVCGMMAFIIPKFEDIYRGMGSSLPLPTKILIGMATFASTHWVLLTAGAIAAGYMLRGYARTSHGALVLDVLKLGLPVVGTLMRHVAVTHFARTMATLHGAGVPVVNGLDMVADSMDNKVMKKVVYQCREDVMAGQTIVESLRLSGYFPEMALSMLAAGEFSGKLDEMLNTVARYYETKVEMQLRSLASLLEPIVIIFVGVCVGFVVVAMMLPVFQLAELMM